METNAEVPKVPAPIVEETPDGGIDVTVEIFPGLPEGTE